MAAFFKRKEELEPLPPMPPSEEDDFEPLPDMDVPDEIDDFPTVPIRSAPQIALPKSKAKVFVKIDKYEDMLNTLDEIKAKVMELEETINKVSDIKSKEAEILEGWKALLMDAKRRVDEVSSVLNTPEN